MASLEVILNWAMTWDFQQCGMCDQQSLRPACAYAQSDQSLCKSLEHSMTVKLLNEHYPEFLSLTGSYIGSSESTLFKMPHCWKSHVAVQLFLRRQVYFSLRRHEIYNNVVCATSKASYQPAHMRSLIRAFASRLNIQWLLSYWMTRTSSGISKLNWKLHRLVWGYTFQNATFLEIAFRSSIILEEAGLLFF